MTIFVADLKTRNYPARPSWSGSHEGWHGWWCSWFLSLGGGAVGCWRGCGMVTCRGMDEAVLVKLSSLLLLRVTKLFKAVYITVGWWPLVHTVTHIRAFAHAGWALPAIRNKLTKYYYFCINIITGDGLSFSGIYKTNNTPSRQFYTVIFWISFIKSYRRKKNSQT